MSLNLRLSIGGSRLLEASRMQQSANRLADVERRRLARVQQAAARRQEGLTPAERERQRQGMSLAQLAQQVPMIAPRGVLDRDLAKKRPAATARPMGNYGVLDILGGGSMVPRLIFAPGRTVYTPDPDVERGALVVEPNTGPFGGPAIFMPSRGFFNSSPDYLYFTAISRPRVGTEQEFCFEGFRAWPVIDRSYFPDGIDPNPGIGITGEGASDVYVRFTRSTTIVPFMSTRITVFNNGARRVNLTAGTVLPDFVTSDSFAPITPGSGYYHWAVSYYGGRLHSYVDGTEYVSLDFPAQDMGSLQILLAGQSLFSYSRLGGFKITLDKTPYKANFTPPTAAFRLP
jgi:hypothetical protein